MSTLVTHPGTTLAQADLKRYGRRDRAQEGAYRALIAAGFAGLIGAHEFAPVTTESADNSRAIVPFILAAASTLSFISAGVMAFRMLRQGGSN